MTHQLDTLIREQLQANGVAGMALAIIDGGAVTYERAYGTDTQTGAALTPDSLFMAGSLTKPVFAAGVLQLCARGVIDLDTPLVEFDPEPIAADPRAAAITARHVLSHTAGLPNWREGETLKFLAAPGTAFAYSGEGYAYLQRVIERRTGAPWAETWRDLVLGPCGMAESRLTWRDYPDPDDQSRLAGPAVPPHWYALSDAASSLFTTAGDYARFLLSLLAAPGGAAALPVLAQMLAPQTALLDHPELGWGLGWGLQPLADETAFWHWGLIGGRDEVYVSYVVALPGRQRGAVLLTNSVEGLPLCTTVAPAALGVADPHPALAWLGV